jgi:hypothetical protein
MGYQPMERVPPILVLEVNPRAAILVDPIHGIPSSTDSYQQRKLEVESDCRCGDPPPAHGHNICSCLKKILDQSPDV